MARVGKWARTKGVWRPGQQVPPQRGSIRTVQSKESSTSLLEYIRPLGAQLPCSTLKSKAQEKRVDGLSHILSF